jgi:replication factor A1
MTEDGRYTAQVTVVKQECPDADDSEIEEEFRRYEEEFLIPPEDALRSVVRKFQTASGMEVTNLASPAKVEKKVNRFSELGADDRNVTIEVAVISYTPRIQMVRDEERQVAFGWIEDNPWENSGQRERWDYKDWGEQSENLAPGSVVRLEGASVNEWNDKRSINVNRTTRVTVLREGGAPVTQVSDEPVSIETASENEGYVNLVARLISSKPDVIVKRDGSGQLDVVRGRLADSSGSIGFLSWVPLEHEPGTLLKIDGASVRKFRETPEINIGDRTRIEVYHDTAFASMDDLSQANKVSIAELRNGMRDIEITVQVESWDQRSFTSEDGTERVVRSGDVLDPSGLCRLTAWCEIDPKQGDFLHLTGSRVQYWQGSPDLVVDDAAQVTDLSDPPWDPIDPEQHWIEADLTTVVTSGSRRGIRTNGTIVAVRRDSGIIERCPECRRVLRDDACIDHGPQRGVEDLRLRFVIDDGVSNASLLLAKDPSEAFLGMDQEAVKEQVDKDGQDGFAAFLRERVLARRLSVRGRSIIDDQGAMLLADEVEQDETTSVDAANEVMQRWGVVL